MKKKRIGRDAAAALFFLGVPLLARHGQWSQVWKECYENDPGRCACFEVNWHHIVRVKGGTVDRERSWVRIEHDPETHRGEHIYPHEHLTHIYIETE